MPRTLRAQALVELGLVLPILLIILLGSIDLGRAFVYGVSVQQGAREGARVASTAALDPTVTDAVVIQRLLQASAPAASTCGTALDTPLTCGGGTWTFSVRVTPSSGSPTYTSLASARGSLASLSGAQVEVRASGSVAMFAGFFAGPLGLGQISVRGDAIMVVV